jgi:hypothetical protein
MIYGGGVPAHVFTVTKRDPASRWFDDDQRSDRGPVEVAYLAAVGAFAGETGVSRVAIR